MNAFTSQLRQTVDFDVVQVELLDTVRRDYPGRSESSTSE